MNQTTRRLDYLDAAKGIGLLLVIYGHTFRDSMRAAAAWCDFSYVLVYRFHVSLLFLLSGMGYALAARRSSLPAGPFVRKKARALLLPWFSYSALIYLAFWLVQLVPQARALLADSAYQLLSPAQYAVLLLRNENPYSFHLWYLPTLFWFTLAAWAIDHLLAPAQAKAAKLALCLLLPGFYALFCARWVWALKSIFQQGIFFFLGCVFPPETLERRAVPLALLGTGCGAVILLELLCPPAALYSAAWTGLVLSWADFYITAGLCLGILAACFLLRSRLRPLARFGRRTMLFYLYHQPFCCAVLGILLYDVCGLPALATVAVCMAASLAVPWCIHKAAGPLRLQGILHRLGLPT